MSYIKIQPPVSSTIMHVSLMQTCNTKIDEQVNAVCITQNSHPHVGYYTPSERLDDRPNLFWYDPTFIMQFSKMQGLTRTQILHYSRSNYIDYTRAVHKETKLFFLVYCFTYNLIKPVSFKILPSTLDTQPPMGFPVLECVLRDGTKVQYRIFYYLLYHLKSATF